MILRYLNGESVLEKKHGVGEIRTLGTLTYTDFPGLHHRPLGHHSVGTLTLTMGE